MDRDLYPYLSMGVEFDGIVTHLWLPAIAILIAYTVVLWFRKRGLSYLLCFFIFGLYILFIVDKVVFPIVVTGTLADVMKQEQWTTFVNLIPFYFGLGSTLSDAADTLLLNILLTIPFGFGISFLMPTNVKKILWIALAVGVGCELSQFIISLFLGYPYRYIDINDVLMNASGILVGYAIFRVFAWGYSYLISYFNIKPCGFFAYLYDIARLSSKAVSKRL